jgi:hypothetical protein
MNNHEAYELARQKRQRELEYWRQFATALLVQAVSDLAYPHEVAKDPVALAAVVDRACVFADALLVQYRKRIESAEVPSNG